MSYATYGQTQGWHEGYVIDGRFYLEAGLLRTEDFVIWKGRDQKLQHTSIMITEHIPGLIVRWMLLIMCQQC